MNDIDLSRQDTEISHFDVLSEQIALSSLVDNLHSGIIIFDSQQHVVYWNRWLEKHSGISAQQAIGQTFAELFPNMMGTRIHEAIVGNLLQSLPAMVSATFNTAPFPLYVSLSSRELIHQNIYITALCDKDRPKKNDFPQNNYCMVNIIDVTASALREKRLEQHVLERKHAETALIEARRLAEEASMAKTRFLTNISHELRTPMNGILGMAELLRNANLDKENNEYVETLVSSGNSLLRLLNDLLDFSKIETGTFSLIEDSFNLKQMVNETIRLSSFKSKEKGLLIELEISEECPEYLLGDVNRIQQVLINLLDNAIKFTSEGKVKVSVDLLDDSVSRCFLNFSVHDTGIGISDEQLPHIFDSFTQIDSGSTRQYAGTGLGLAISKQLIEMMHGELIVDSFLGKGSTFSFMLPLQKDIKSTIEYSELNKNIKKLSGHALLIENDVSSQKVATAMLNRLGLSVDTAGTGEEALIKSTMYNYDLILMDLGLPDIDGIHVTWVIKARMDMDNKNVPIIALTAKVTEQDKKNCFDAGMCDFIAKPITLHTLQKTLAMWL